MWGLTVRATLSPHKNTQGITECKNNCTLFLLLLPRFVPNSYSDNYQDAGGVALFVTGDEISRWNNSCTIKVRHLGASGTITIGIGPEKYPTGAQPGWKENSVALHGDDGK